MIRSLFLLSAALGAAFAGVRVGTFPQEVRTFYTTADGLPSNDVTDIEVANGRVYAKTSAGVSAFASGKWTAADAAQVKFREGSAKLGAADSRGIVWVAHVEAVERRGEGRVRAYTAADGLPYDDFTSVAVASDGNVVWF